MDGILVAGSIIVDRINRISGYPSRGELTKISSTSRSCGGLVPNVAVDLARIAPKIPIKACGKVGADSDGDYVLSVLENAGVDCSLVVKSPGSVTSFTDVFSEDAGERTFFCFPGASSEFGADDIPFDSVGARLCHLGYFLLLDKIDSGDGLVILKEMQRRGIETSIDLVTENSTRYESVIPCLKYTDNLIVNEVEASRLAGIGYDGSNLPEIMARLRSFGVRKRVIVHEPSQGAVLSENGFTSVPSLSLPGGWIKGSTGAGDAFCAGALYAIYEGWDDTGLLEFAVRSAAVSLRSEDAVGAMCSASEIKDICSCF